MKDVFVETPFAQVEFATETGGLTIYQKNEITSDKMDFDILSIDTSRDVGGDDCPTFSITLAFKKEWYERVGANDLVTIKLGRGKDKWTVMYGMIDTIYKTMSYVDLKPTRTITISGRGFNKALIQFGIGAVQEINFSFQSVGFFEGQSEGISETTPARLIKTVFEYYLDNGINSNFANGKSFKDMIGTIFQENPEEDVTLGNVMGYYDYQGGLWDYIKELRNAPFYEAFWEIIDDKPTFFVRPTPFNPDNWTKLLMTQLDDRDIIDENLGRTDLETYSVYAVKGESVVSNLENIFGSPIWYEPFYEKYGLRRLQVQSKYQRFAEQMEENTDFSEVHIGSGVGGKLAYPVGSAFGITSGYGYRNNPTGSGRQFHYGLDFGASSDSDIYAAADGIVKNIAFDGDRGHYIDIDHENGMMTRYQHCIRRPSQKQGSKVKRGQVIANVGSSGDSTGAHLHFEVHVNGKTVDPTSYIKGDKAYGNKGGAGPYYDAPIRSINWDVNENTSKEYLDKLVEAKRDEDKEKLQEKIDIKENIKNSKEELNSDSLAFNKGMNDFLDFADNRNKEQAEELKKTQEIANDVDLEEVSDKTIDLFNWNIRNNDMENGTILVKGREYQVGTRLYNKSTDMEYYLEKVSHSFVFNETWTTNLEVTRGLPLGTRFQKPWNEWKLMTPEDMEAITGISQEFMSYSNVGGSSSKGKGKKIPGLRGKIQEKAYAMEGLPYDSGDKRMSERYADCSSFVYRAVMEALGKSWKGTWAPSTYDWADKKWSDLWYEIPLSEIEPWDILWRQEHTEFYTGDNTFGAHDQNTPAGLGYGYRQSDWTKAYRVVGL